MQENLDKPPFYSHKKLFFAIKLDVLCSTKYFLVNFYFFLFYALKIYQKIFFVEQKTSNLTAKKL